MDALILLSFANALFYEENFEENHKREEKRKKAKKRVVDIESIRIESIRWNERETRRMARVVVKKEWMFLFFTLR
jgi:protein required for attachment to host cells